MSYLGKNSSNAFLKGFQTVLDLYPTVGLPEELELPENGSKLDSNALNSDWKKIGNDIENAIRKYENS